MYQYKAIITKVIDGDTVDVDIDLGFEVWLRNQRIRLYGIDTPESRTSDKEEKVYGLAAKAFLKEALKQGPVTLRTVKDGKGKFGRILGEFIVNNININEFMIINYHGVAYHGQSKEDIAEEHLANRLKVKL